ncbi:DUF3040 domain-containing protein [Actinoplanes oblitus]|uniref:DUF3040 domain-containing protein n=1 Tax=Actinoplanes oblitus TaxID=3040509 RepID=A0ABY8WP03_9ACTN|nr:DUF3040 domain-containing protein [Actinoplanes oblitus]WIM99368.1 DUF3040 domain-containing protein [Actinoplanes oblitus]
MLEESDRRVLADIEHHLSAGDPAFARRMRSGDPPACAFPTVSVLCVGTFLSTPFLGLFLGPRGVLIAINVTAVVILLILLCRTYHRGRF